LLLAAAVFIFTPFFQLSKYGNKQDGQTYMQAGKVVQQGLYALIRHPQYLGYMLLACGFTLLSQHWVTVLLASVSVVSFYVQAIKEESYCLFQFGEPYAGYLQRVPRFNLIQGIWMFFRRKA
jgi:protein-S-isoprenylcysteine O-methyltransferase Ste14